MPAGALDLTTIDPGAVKVVSEPGTAQAAVDLTTIDPAKVKVVGLPKPVPAKPEGVGPYVDAALRGAAQGVTFEFADEAAGAAGGLYDYAMGKLGQRGDISLSDAYHTRRDAARRADQAAEAAHPAVYLGGNIGGSLATAFVPGASALNVGKGAGLIEAAGKGAAAGAISGAGQAKEFTDIPAEAARGAEVGASIGGALNVAGKVGSAVLDKLRPAAVGSVLLNAPESALQRYIDNPAAVNAARPRSEIVQDEFLPRLEALQFEVKGGSKASRDILAQEGKTVPGSAIADILDAKKAEILKRSEGVLDDPRHMAAVRWLEDTADKYRPQADAAGQVVDKQLSTNRAKDLIQNLDNQTEFEVAPGRFAKVDDTVRRDIRSEVDALLKGESKAYTSQMRHVAGDAQLLDEVSHLAKTPAGFDSLLKRTQRGTAPQQLKTLEAFDKRTGGGLLEDLQNSAVKDRLAQGAMNGSRNVNLYGNFGKEIGEAIGGIPGRIIGGTIGYLGGATVDKYGPAMAKNFVDTTARVQSMMQSSQGLQALGKYAQPLMEAALKGNQALAATNAYLLETDPNYARLVGPTAVERRLSP